MYILDVDMSIGSRWLKASTVIHLRHENMRFSNNRCNGAIVTCFKYVCDCPLQKAYTCAHLIHMGVYLCLMEWKCVFIV